MERTTVNRRYRVDRRIGEGGMAEVYLGHDLLLNRVVAIKAMRPHFAADASFRARFEREAIAVAGLTHPNIVEIFDVGEQGGRPYFVMEYVRGDTLKTVIEQEGPFAPDDVAALLEQVGSALDVAHERGIVHRDVKPQNILVTPDGVVKVLDFGIAKDIHDSGLTELGTGLGTVHYLSPEQANGLMATPSSDVYSLGVVAYEMLTGRLPFVADSPVAVAMLHVHEPPRPPSSVFPHVPRQVDVIVMRALEKDPTRRYQTAGSFAAAMTDWRTQPASAAPGAVSSGWPAAWPPPADAPTADPRSRPPSLDPAPASGANQSAGRRTAAVGSPAGATIATPVGSGSAQTAEATGDAVGCTTWAVGSLVLVALVALVWVGFRLSPRLTDSGAGGPTAPAAADASAGTFSGADFGAAERPAPTGAPTTAAAVDPSSPRENTRSVPVPNLIGKSLTEARTLVTDRGLLIEDDEPVFSESVPPDAVAEQDPPPDVMVEQGSIVVIKLSRGSGTVSLVDLGLLGLDAAEAELRLGARGVGVERVEVGDPDAPRGVVVEIDPATQVNIGDSVTLYVSVGDRVQVPAAVQGRPLEDVARQLERLEFEIVDQVPMDRQALDAAGIDLNDAGIEPGDVVGYGVDGGLADFDVWLARGTEITVYYYDPNPDAREADE